MKRLLAMLLCVITLAGCGSQGGAYIPTGDGLHQDVTTVPTEPEAEKEQELILVYYPNKSLNPYLSTDFTNRALFPLVYQGLFSVDDQYNVVPILCKNYKISKDMTVHTFYLENATFSDGEVITPEDVVASLQMAKSNGAYTGRLTQIQSIRESDDGGVVITTNTPYENLAILLDIPIVKAEEVNAERPLGTGAYYYDDSIAGLRLCRRNNWWCYSNMSVTASTIPLRQGTSPSQIRDSFQFDNVSLVCADPGSDTFADFRCDYELWDCENGIFLYLACNMQSEVFSNTTIRSALTHAVDRDLLVNSYYRGFARSATLPASPQSPYYNTNLARNYGYDAAAFAAAVEASGMAGREIVLLVNSDDTMRVRAARAIANMLRESGLKVKLSELGGSSYRNALKKGNYDLHLGQTKLSPNMDLSAFFATKGALNYGGLGNASFLTACWDALANSGNYYTLHKKVMEDGCLVPILFRSYAVYTERGTFASLDPARDNIFFYSIGKTMESIQVKAG